MGILTLLALPEDGPDFRTVQISRLIFKALGRSQSLSRKEFFTFAIASSIVIHMGVVVGYRSAVRSPTDEIIVVKKLKNTNNSFSISTCMLFDEYYQPKI